MIVTQITAKRVVHKSIGQYEFDERIFEFTASVTEGEDVAAATDKLYGLLDSALRGGPQKPVRVEAPKPLVVEAPKPVLVDIFPPRVEAPKPLVVEAPWPALVDIFPPRVEAVAVPEPVAVEAVEAVEAGGISPGDFAKKVAGLGVGPGHAKVMALLNGRRVSQVPAEERAGFLAALQA